MTADKIWFSIPLSERLLHHPHFAEARPTLSPGITPRIMRWVHMGVHEGLPPALQYIDIWGLIRVRWYFVT